MAQTCDNCIKRSTCEPKGIIDAFVIKQGPRFERVDALIAQKAWMAFLGGRCREHLNEKGVRDAKNNNSKD